MKHIVAIDFGSSKVVTAVGITTPSGIKVVAYEEEPVTIGIKNGEITNDTRVEQNALLPTIRRAEEKIGEKITEAYVNISGKFIDCSETAYSVIRPRPDNDITEKELAEYTAKQFNRKFDNPHTCVFEALAQTFNVDDNIGYSREDVIGMSGANLEINYKLIYGNESIIEHRRKVLANCGIKMIKGIVSPIASARAVLSDQEMENGVALVDIGKGCTQIAIIKNNVTRFISSIPFGGESITNDIKQVTNLSSSWAERVKVEYGCCVEEVASESKKLILHGEGGAKEDEVELVLLTKVIEARISEILEAACFLIDQSGYGKKIPNGVVLTGGSCYLQYIQDLAKVILDRKVRLGAPMSSISPDSVEESFDAFSSTAVGIILEANQTRLSSSYTFVDRQSTNIKPSEEPVEKEDLFKEDHSEDNNDSKSSGIFGLFSKKKSKNTVTDTINFDRKESTEDTLIGEEENEPAFEEEVVRPKVEEKPTFKPEPKQKSKTKTKSKQDQDSWGLFKDIFSDNNEA